MRTPRHNVGKRRTGFVTMRITSINPTLSHCRPAALVHSALPNSLAPGTEIERRFEQHGGSHGGIDKIRVHVRRRAAWRPTSPTWCPFSIFSILPSPALPCPPCLCCQMRTRRLWHARRKNGDRAGLSRGSRRHGRRDLFQSFSPSGKSVLTRHSHLPTLPPRLTRPYEQ